MNKKDYLSIREAANKMGYTRQYVYKELDNKFKNYLKIIDGEKKLHINVLKEFGSVKQNPVDSQATANLADNNSQLDSRLVDKTIAKNVKKNNDDSLNNVDYNSLQSTTNKMIDILRQQLTEKDEQLSEKDKQIQNLQDELNLQNEHVRKQSDRLVDLVEQVNELQRNNQVLLAQKDIDNTKEIVQSKEHKGMFSWLFKKNN